MFDDSVVVTPPKADEIECDDTQKAGPALSDDERAVMELQERIGDKRFEALLQLMRERGVPAGVPLNRQRCEQISRLMEGQQGLTAEDLRASRATRAARRPS